MQSKAEVKSKSLKKALDILNLFIEKQPLGVTEIGHELGLNKSNVYDILSTLCVMDYLLKDEVSGKYYLGRNAFRLGQAVGDRFCFQKIAAEHIRKLACDVGEIVYLSAPMGRQVLFLDTAFPSRNYLHLLGFHTTMDYMHCTASGKAMLANMSEDEINNYLALPLESMTDYSITLPEALRKELETVRRLGFAVDRMENTIGIDCVAVPILHSNGNVQGAISVSGPTQRFTDERIAELARKLMEQAKIIQDEM